MSEIEIKERITPAMYSRIGESIEYVELSSEQKKKIITDWHTEIMLKLKDDEKPIIEKTCILQWILDNADRYDNIRILKMKLENAVYDELTQHYIINEQ